jgi:hypothetical protein
VTPSSALIDKDANMSKVLLITWRNMIPKVLPELSANLKLKHAASGYEELFFDDGPLQDVLLGKIPADRAERVKIYISGHGGVGIDYIADDTETHKKTVDELAALLGHALRNRANSKAECAATQINMVSCLFARTPDGNATTSPAAKLHQKLANDGIYVDLVGRTESVVATSDGRKTISLLHHKVYEPVYGRKADFYVEKVPYSKVLHTFEGDERRIKMASYSPVDGHYVDTSNLQGRRVLWAEHAVNRIIERIKLDAKTKEIKDARQKKLSAIVAAYDALRRPELFKSKLEELVDTTSTSTDTSDNFLLHRDWFRTKSAATPKTAVFVQELLSTYPTA